jgi:hypothetical protein
VAVTDERPRKSYLGRLGMTFGIVGACIGLGMLAFVLFMLHVAAHMADGIG